jgi:hypothetical protein
MGGIVWCLGGLTARILGGSTGTAGIPPSLLSRINPAVVLDLFRVRGPSVVVVVGGGVDEEGAPHGSLATTDIVPNRSELPDEGHG